MQVEFRGITKCFGPLRANDDISFIIPSLPFKAFWERTGQVKALSWRYSGYYSSDAGEIYLNGKKVDISCPGDAIDLGIGMLHQDPLDFPPLKVIDNFILGKKGGILPNRGSAIREFEELADRFDFSIDPEAYVDSLYRASASS